MPRFAIFRRSVLAGTAAALLCSIGRLTAEPERKPAVPRPGAPRPGLVERLREKRIPFAAQEVPLTARGVAATGAAKQVADFVRETVGSIEKGRRPGGRRPRSAEARRPRSARGIATTGTAASGETMDVRRLPGVETPRMLRGRGLHRATDVQHRPGATREERDVATAKSFLRENRGVLRMRDPDAEFRVERTEIDALGCCQVRLAQTFRGLDVWPSRAVVQVGANGDVDSFSGAFVPTPRRVVTKPSIGPDRAATLAREAVPGGAGEIDGAPELIVHAGKSLSRLAWKTEVDVSAFSSWTVVIDAHNGAVLRKFDRVAHQDTLGSGTDALGQTRQIRVWNDGGTYFMVDASKPMFDPASDPPNGGRGVILIADGRNGGPQPLPDFFHVTSANPAAWPLPDAVSASFGLSETFDYFLDRHGRNSIDGQGGSLLGAVRVGSGFVNAFWLDGLMAFGDGDEFAGSLDVVGHEMSHGVTEKTAGLIYQAQSGALNESMSDIFGEMVESRTFGDNDWILGTELVDGSLKRNLANPAAFEIQPGFPYPSRMSQYYDLPVDGNNDNGGVHINSSIINHAFYLFAEGLPNAVGKENAEQVFYRALTTKLVPQSQFVDCRLAVIASARELFGDDSLEAAAAADAFDAVEIFDASSTPAPPSAPPVVGEDSTICLYYDPDVDAVLVARRETALGDGAAGETLVAVAAAVSRPAVSGDGSVVAFVDATNDLCFARTATDDLDAYECLGLPGTVSSVAFSPGAERFAFVLLDANGDPLPSITVLDLATDEATTFPLVAPVIDGGSIQVVRADFLDFSRDGEFLIYDAFNVLRLPDGSTLGTWSLYGLDLSTESTVLLVPPTPGLDIGNPSFASTTDRLVTFEGYDSAAAESTVFVRDLFSGDTTAVVTVTGSLAMPCFSGDDRRIVVTAPDMTNSGSSLFAQDLAEDSMTPVGDPALWLSDGALGVIYRRGLLPPPPAAELVELVLETQVPKIDTLDFDVPVGETDVPVRLELSHALNGGIAAGGTCTVDGVPVLVSGRLKFSRASRSWIAALTLIADAPEMLVKVNVDLARGTATVNFRGEQGRTRARVGFAAQGYLPTTRISLRPTVDVAGRISGTATILGGFGNDLNSVATLTGKIRGKVLKLVVLDIAALRKISFRGVRAGSDYRGKLVFKLPPAAGSARGFAVPAVFGR